MLSKCLAKSLLTRTTPVMGAAVCRGVYTDDTRPYVFINQHTKVICQGMTGKHVSFLGPSAIERSLVSQIVQIFAASFRSF
jgi:hypothetical protein